MFCRHPLSFDSMVLLIVAGILPHSLLLHDLTCLSFSQSNITLPVISLKSLEAKDFVSDKHPFHPPQPPQSIHKSLTRGAPIIFYKLVLAKSCGELSSLPWIPKNFPWVAGFSEKRRLPKQPAFTFSLAIYDLIKESLWTDREEVWNS